MTNCNEEEKILPNWKKVFINREEFLKLISLASGGIIALAIAIPSAIFTLSYLFFPKRPEWVNIGPVEHFQSGQTVPVVFKEPHSLAWEGVVARRTAWLRRDTDETFIAFASNCTHLGCPIRWEAKAELFLCPCHGGVFYSNGDVAGGPPPRALHRYPVRIRQGQVEIEVGPILTKI